MEVRREGWGERVGGRWEVGGSVGEGGVRCGSGRGIYCGLSPAFLAVSEMSLTSSSISLLVVPCRMVRGV